MAQGWRRSARRVPDHFLIRRLVFPPKRALLDIAKANLLHEFYRRADRKDACEMWAAHLRARGCVVSQVNLVVAIRVRVFDA